MKLLNQLWESWYQIKLKIVIDNIRKSYGVLENWSNGAMVKDGYSFDNTPILHHSIIPWSYDQGQPSAVDFPFAGYISN